MKRFIRAIPVGIIMLIFLGSYLIPNAEEPLTRKAEIIEIEGKAEVKAVGAKRWKPAELGMEIVSGDLIKARKGSYVDIDITKPDVDNAVVRVTEGSTIEPDISSPGITINIITGKVVFSDKKIEGEVRKFEIRTPNSIIGIEGSHGVVNYSEQNGATDSYLKVAGGYVVNVSSGKYERLNTGANYVQVEKEKIEKKKKKIYSWDLQGLYGSHAFAGRGLERLQVARAKYSKAYLSGAYRTSVNVANGQVMVAPYDEEGGPAFDEGINIFTGQQLVMEDEILVVVEVAEKEKAAQEEKVLETKKKVEETQDAVP